MYKVISCFVFVLVVGSMLSGCLFDGNESGVTVASIGPQPLEWRPGHYKDINVTLDAKESLSNVTVNLTGLKNTYGQLKLYESKLVDLHNGYNDVIFEIYVPSCSSCNKLSPGPYNVTVTVTHKGSVLCEQVTTAYLLE
jgi:hypothetical protein